MERLTFYREVIHTIINRHAHLRKVNETVETISICDTNNDNYLLIAIGWNASGRVHSIAFHLRIKNNKIWIEWDGTEEGVTQELVELGVAKKDIVLGFYRPERRALTEFALT